MTILHDLRVKNYNCLFFKFRFFQIGPTENFVRLDWFHWTNRDKYLGPSMWEYCVTMSFQKEKKLSSLDLMMHEDEAHLLLLNKYVWVDSQWIKPR